jgi:predicted nucleic acid-binding protein
VSASPATTLVVDVSVVAKWYLPEPDSAAAIAAARGARVLLAPDLLPAELGNIFWKKIRSGELADRDARHAISRFTAARPVTLRPSISFLGDALDIAVRYQRTVYDALYVALAVIEGCQLMTADQRLANALQNTPLASYITKL